MSKMNIKVMGGGCSKCETLLRNTKEAVKAAGIDADVEYITDFGVIAGYGVMSTPALVVNEKVVSAGRVLKPADIEKLIK
jgi:small redox-active disulfide protein 2